MENLTNKILAVVLAIFVIASLTLTLTACTTPGPQGEQGVQGIQGAAGADGQTPFIGENGNWWIGNFDTGVAAAAKNGINGTDGKDGVDGNDGVNGKDGKDGKDGADGTNGVNGIDGKDGVDGITPLFSFNGETGYIYISYDNGNSFVKFVDLGGMVQDGADGKDGVGVLGANIDSEGNLVIVLTDKTELKLGCVVGKDGTNGTNGTNGKNGADGITPQLKIGENDEWLVSYDNGENWMELGAQATGAKGDDGLTPIIRIEGGYWEYSYNNGSTWISTAVKAEGTDGKNGEDGEDGISIECCEINDKGELVIFYSNNTSQNLGKITFTENDSEGSTGDTVTTELYTDGLAFYPINDGNEYGVKIGNAIYMTEIVIPSSYNGKPVTEILPGWYSPVNEEEISYLEKVVIPDTVVKIWAKAFTNCTNLTSVTLSANIREIGNEAFYGCVSLEITVPATVTTIGDNAFTEVKSVIYESE